MIRFAFILISLFTSGVLSFAGDLPANDAGKYQLVVVGQPDSVPAKWFSTDTNLAKVKNAVAFTLYPPNSAMFKERYKSTLGTEFPIVAYLRPDGGVIYFADRNTLPTSSNGLFEEMKAAVFLAKNARPASALPEEMQLPVNLINAIDTEDCPDGSCKPPSEESDPRFPRLRPFAPKHPVDADPFEAVRPRSGWLSNSVSSGIFLVFSIVALGFVLLFAILMLGAMVVVARWIVK